jgi:hypothetical protein
MTKEDKKMERFLHTFQPKEADQPFPNEPWLPTALPDTKLLKTVSTKGFVVGHVHVWINVPQKGLSILGLRSGQGTKLLVKW